MKRLFTIVLALVSFSGFSQNGKADFEGSTYFNLGWVFPNMDHVNTFNPKKNTFRRKK
jgi:hypothetical protein